jgi:hypothetical protein
MLETSQIFASVSGKKQQEHVTPTYLKGDFGSERGPPQRKATETGEEAYETAIMSDIEREAMRGLLESVC